MRPQPGVGFKAKPDAPVSKPDAPVSTPDDPATGSLGPEEQQEVTHDGQGSARGAEAFDDEILPRREVEATNDEDLPGGKVSNVPRDRDVLPHQQKDDPEAR